VYGVVRSQAACPHITTTEIHKFFVNNIAGVQASIDGVCRLALGAMLNVFQPVDVEEMS